MLPAVGHACPRAEWKEGRCPPPHLAALALEAAPGLRPWCLGVSLSSGRGGGQGRQPAERGPRLPVQGEGEAWAAGGPVLRGRARPGVSGLKTPQPQMSTTPNTLVFEGDLPVTQKVTQTQGFDVRRSQGVREPCNLGISDLGSPSGPAHSQWWESGAQREGTLPKAGDSPAGSTAASVTSVALLLGQPLS